MKNLFSTILFHFSHLTRAAPPRNIDHHFVFTAWCECDSFLYIGTNHGLFRKNKENGQLSFHNRLNSKLPDNAITSIICTQEGFTFIGTKNGLARWDNTNTQLTKAECIGLPDTHITSLTADHNGDVWIGTASAGLVKSKGDKQHSLDLQPVSTCNKNIYSMVVDPQDNLWVVFQDDVIENFHKGILKTKHPNADGQLEVKGNEKFLLTTRTQGAFLTDGCCFNAVPVENSSSGIICTYYNVKYSRLILCNKDGIHVFRTNDPFSGSQSWKYSDFMESIALHCVGKTLHKTLNNIKRYEQANSVLLTPEAI